MKITIGGPDDIKLSVTATRSEWTAIMCMAANGLQYHLNALKSRGLDPHEGIDVDELTEIEKNMTMALNHATSLSRRIDQAIDPSS